MPEVPYSQWPKCDHVNGEQCGGKITPTELVMARLEPTHTASEYHHIMYLFEEAYDVMEEEAHGGTE
jgi:hypothetical protein